MRVQINPEKGPTGLTRKVFHPRTRKPFPDGAFELTEKDMRDPAVLRLLPPPGTPGGVAGGVMADLVPVPVSPAEASKKDAPASPVAPAEGRDQKSARAERK